jgi:penicillin-binding protein 2
MKLNLLMQLSVLLPVAVAPCLAVSASDERPHKTKLQKTVAKTTARTTSSQSKSKSNSLTSSSGSSKKRSRYSPWDTPTYADSAWGDSLDGEDLAVRRAAAEALGPYNGTVVVADPQTGRVLSIINQKLAVAGAYQPCSTIKLVAGLAGLSEGIIDRETKLRLSRRSTIDLTNALAKSNNAYFANVGEKLGFERVNYYARLFGLGEKAGLGIEGESSGIFPEAKPKEVPVGMMTSFGEAIGLTPLQLAALVGAIANGGTLYYLQYPRNQEEASAIVPRVKRTLDISRQIPDMLPGMMGAVDFGTARRAGYDANEPIWGKTGTCTDSRTHLGWFGSFNAVGHNRLVVVVLLTGGKSINGPVAAGIAGQVYRNLSQQQYWATQRQTSPAALVSASEAR